MLGWRLETHRLEAGNQQARQPVNAPGDALQPLGTMVYGIHTCHHGQQGLCRAYIAGRLVAPDVLFPGLQSHSQGGLVLAVLGNTDDPAGDRALETIPGGKKSGMWTAKAHWNTEALGWNPLRHRHPFPRVTSKERDSSGRRRPQPCAPCHGQC